MMPNQYYLRREKFMQNPNTPSIILIFSGTAPTRSADETYPFSVDRNFYYLTGLSVENAVLLMYRTDNNSIFSELYINTRDESHSKWFGFLPSFSELCAISEIQCISPLSHWKQRIFTLLSQFSAEAAHSIGMDLWKFRTESSETLAESAKKYLQSHCSSIDILDIHPLFIEARLTKSEDEITSMMHAQQYTRKAIEFMLSHAKPEINESELEGLFIYSLYKQGVREVAFPSIIAGGERASILHYQSNNQIIHDHELVLVDLGGTCNHYCADISRTFPVNGQFTKRQRQLYNLVLEAQELVIQNAVPGKTLLELNDLVIQFYQKELPKLGLLQNGSTVKDYYYHGVSHPLGLDTHDICMPEYEVLKPGMVITVEPGIYIPEEKTGIRIEDDLLITAEAPVNLSADIIKSADEIEAFMNTHN